MKKFHYPDGRVSKETMTAAELISKLSEYPADMPVFGAWEGVAGCITADSFAIEDDFYAAVPAQTCRALMIDVEKY